MRAAIRSMSGIFFQQDYPKPECGAKDILVQVKSAAINPVDYKIKIGRLITGPVVGFDFAGIVVKVGKKVDSSFEIGNEVFGSANGSLAEYTIVLPNEISLKPQNISFSQAACLNVAYLTSLQGLRDYGKLPEDGRILIIGASGGCGTAAIQIAKYLKAKDIVAICSGKNEEFVRALGATDVIDYTDKDIKEYYKNDDGMIDNVNKFDVIYDAASFSGAGEDYKKVSLDLLKQGNDNTICGHYVAINGSPWMWLQALTIGFRGNQCLFLTKANTKDLEMLAQLADEGWINSNGNHDKLEPIIAEELSLSEEGIKKGFELLKSRRVKGKIVFSVCN